MGPLPAAVAAMRRVDSGFGRTTGFASGWRKVTSGSSMIGKPGIGVQTRFMPVAVCWSEKEP